MPTLVVIVFVALGEAASPTTDALTLALRGSLGGTVLIRESADPLDESLADVARNEHATLVATVRWTDAERPRAAIRAYLSSPAASIERTLVFGPNDDPRERGRAVGLVLATLVPDARPERPVAAPPVVIERAPEPPPAPERWTVEGAAMGAMGVAGVGGGFGGALGVQRRLSPRWSIRAGACAWVGEVAEAQASSRTLAAGLGVASLLTPPERRLGLALRLDLLALDESLAHYSDDDPAPVRRSRLLPAADLMAEASLRLSGGASLTLAAGALAQAGKTDIFVHGLRVADLPPVRLVTQAGLRVRL